MTREEAMEELNIMPLDLSHCSIKRANRIEEAMDMAISALRPISREQVERVRGKWIEDKYSFSHCSLCGYEQEEPELITPFCANCGAPMTDEAVEMIMKRLEQVNFNE